MIRLRSVGSADGSWRALKDEEIDWDYHVRMSEVDGSSDGEISSDSVRILNVK